MKRFWLLISIAFLSQAFAKANEVPAVDPREEFPGGSGSTSDFSVQAFSHPMSGTRGELRRVFTVGNSFFNTVWAASPSSTTLRDGLGPMYNAVSCSSCHFKDGRGRGLPEKEGAVDVSLLFRLRVKGATSSKDTFPHPAYGGQFQPQSIMGVKSEGTPMVRYQSVPVSYSDGTIAELFKPIYELINLNFGPLGSNAIVSPRVAPQMIGLGLIESIPEADILANEDASDEDGDGISGRANRVYSLVENKIVLGRFGWKAGKPSILEQSAAAFNGDMGITSALFPNEECTDSQLDCKKNHTELDIDTDRLNDVTVYSQLLAVPMRRDFSKPEVLRGRQLFYEVSCVKCHTPSYTTRADASLDVLKNQKIYPYSDFLLHDMGDELADDREDYLNEEGASSREWRTPPLWGLGLTQDVNSHTRYLHDGRARNLEEAILWHGGEASNSKDQYMSLPKSDRSSIIEFLKSL